LVEQLICNHQVGGSIPLFGTISVYHIYFAVVITLIYIFTSLHYRGHFMELKKSSSLIKAAMAGAVAVSVLSACAHHTASHEKNACKANAKCKADMGCKAQGTCTSKPSCAEATEKKASDKMSCKGMMKKGDKMACASKAGCHSDKQ
jgi:hypothetical protein